MKENTDLKKHLNSKEKKIIDKLNTPEKIQKFLDTIVYSSDNFYRSPIRVLNERVGHCFDGAVFAAAILRTNGFQPLILDMIPNNRDDDHVLALFKIDGYWGAIAKSNFVGLRYREPIHKTLRELVLSYFEQYYNLAKEKTLRGFTRQLNLSIFDKYNWFYNDEAMDLIAEKLDCIKKYQLIDPQMEKRLLKVDDRTYEAGLIGSNKAGLYKP